MAVSYRMFYENILSRIKRTSDIDTLNALWDLAWWRLEEARRDRCEYHLVFEEALREAYTKRHAEIQRWFMPYSHR